MTDDIPKNFRYEDYEGRLGVDYLGLQKFLYSHFPKGSDPARLVAMLEGAGATCVRGALEEVDRELETYRRKQDPSIAYASKIVCTDYRLQAKKVRAILIFLDRSDRINDISIS